MHGLVISAWRPFLSAAERFIVREVDFGILRSVFFLRTEERVEVEVLVRETLAIDCACGRNISNRLSEERRLTLLEDVS